MIYKIGIALRLCLSKYVLLTVKYKKTTHNVNVEYKINVFLLCQSNSFDLK